MPTTSLGLRYPGSTDNVNVPEDIQNLAVDVDDLLVEQAATVQRIVKSADESVTSSTTLQNDDELFASVLANTNYVFEGVFNFTGDTNADFKMAFTFPTGAELYMHFMTYDTALTNFGSFAQYNPASGTSSAGGVGGATTYRPTHVRGSLFVGGTAGTLQLQWAQNASNAAATILRKGSLLIVEQATS